jgi:hypothetical protein
MLALAVAYFGWGFLAGDYFQNTPNEGPSETNFWVNSIAQLPNAPSVIRYAFRERLWVIVLIVVAEVGVLILWGVMRNLEREFSGMPRGAHQRSSSRRPPR